MPMPDDFPVHGIESCHGIGDDDLTSGYRFNLFFHTLQPVWLSGSVPDPGIVMIRSFFCIHHDFHPVFTL
ncbi:hypothetical protein SXCC_02964 [Gluconacetobacter sp. SXCC-1]|nr:hypothetical protein SXCC_02964 [Gluconacetobacter sp. SXCC-1]